MSDSFLEIDMKITVVHNNAVIEFKDRETDYTISTQVYPSDTGDYVYINAKLFVALSEMTQYQVLTGLDGFGIGLRFEPMTVSIDSSGWKFQLVSLENS